MMTTIAQALSEASARIARTDARVLLAHVMGRTKEFFIMHPEQPLSDAERMRFLELVQQAQQGCPIAYLVGYKAFWGRDFRVTPEVLIPRPDTETLIECALALSPRPASILDMGTGSGCIAITLALELPESTVMATDVSAKALAVAQENASRLGAQRITFAQGCWYEAVRRQTFDLIVSNPPYIEPHDKHLANLTFEPIGALTDGVDGLSALRTIAQGAIAHLAPNGALMLEHGYDQGAAVRALLEAQGLHDVCTVRDLGGNERITVGHR